MIHQQRPWIKVQLSANVQAQEAAALVKTWKTHRQAAAQIVRAVRLYAALGQGDLSILDDYFPGLVRSTSALLTTPRRISPVVPTITYAAKSEVEDLDDALAGLGLEDLDFGRQ
jgi:hypothetical protein